MKRLALILYLFSMTADAEWKLALESERFEAYIDYSRIKTEGQYLSVWGLDNFKAPQTVSSGKQIKSTVAKMLIDCQASRKQSVALYIYSEHMGKGEAVFSTSTPFQESNWQYPPPNSIGDGYINIACGRK